MPDMRVVLTHPDRAWTEAAPVPGPPDARLDLGAVSTRDWWGFGGCFNELGWEALQLLPETDRAALLDELFDPQSGCRFNYCRLPIGANDYSVDWYSLDEHPDDWNLDHFSIARDEQRLIPYVRSALSRRRDLRLFASPWSPPTWLKHPRAYNHGTLRDEDRAYATYARYFLKFVRAYRQAGIEIESVHVQNEPDSDQKFPSCRWTHEQFSRFIGPHLGPLFEREAERCEIWLGTIERPEYARWLGPVMLDPDARRHVRGAGFQWAGKFCVADARRAHPDLPLIQTENECGDGSNGWTHAHHVFSLVRRYLDADVQAYVYWNFVLPVGGLSTWGWRQNAMISVDPVRRTSTLNPEFFVMKHLSHFIEPGARQIMPAGAWSNHAVAFVNRDGHRVVILHNPYARDVVVGVDRWSVRMPPMSIATCLLD